MANNLDLVKFVIENVKDKTTGQYVDLDKIDPDIKSLFKSAVSAVNPNDFIGIRDKIIDEITGQMYVEIVTEAKNAMNVSSALTQKTSALGRYSLGQAIPVQTLSGFRTLTSKEAMKLVEENVTSAGGTFVHSPTKSNPNRYSYTVPIDDMSKVKEMRKQLFGGEAGRIESISKRNIKEKEKEQEDKAKDKENSEHKRQVRRNFTKAIAVITLLTDITRRIFTALMNRATQIQQDTMEAHNLGISYQDVRDARVAEIAHGMKQGTITGAMSDIQSMFGNITMIDDSALEKLALIMGTQVEDLVRSGIGGSNPQQLLGAIVDAFSERASQGYNSVGQYVGEAQARRELYSLLNKISPQIADVFSAFQEAKTNANSIYRGVGSYEEFITSSVTNRYGVTPTEEGVVTTMNDLNSSIKSLIEQLKNAITVALAPEITELLNKIANSRVFMDERASMELDTANREANRNYIATAKARIAKLDETLPSLTGVEKIEAEALKRALNKTVTEAEAENKKKTKVANIAGMATENYIKTIAGGYAVDYVAEDEAGKSYFDFADKYSDYFNERGYEALLSFFGSDEAVKARIDKEKENQYKVNKKRAEEAYAKKLNKKVKKLTDEERETAKKEFMEEYMPDMAMIPAILGALGNKKLLERTINLVKDDIRKETESGMISSSMYIPDNDVIQSMLQKANKDVSGTYSIKGVQIGTGSQSVYKLVLDIKNDGITEDDIVLFQSGKGVEGFQGDIGEYSNGIVTVSAVKS